MQTAPAFNGSMNYGPALPMHNQPGMSQQMRGPPGTHHQHYHQHHQQQHPHQQQYPNQHPRMRGLPRGAAMHQYPQQFVPGGGMNAGAPGFYPPNGPMLPMYMDPIQSYYMEAPPMYNNAPSMQAMPMGMAGMPMPVPSTRQPPKRKSKRLDIIDPDTGLAITFNSNSSVGRTSSTSSAATVEDIHMDAGEQKKLQEKKSTSIEELPVTSPAPNMSMADTKQNGAATSVTQSPEESLVSKAANKDPKPAAYPAKGLEPTRGTNGVKEAESVGKAAAETSGFKTSEGTASTTRKPTTTTTSTSAKVSSPKRQTQSAKDPAEETFAAKQPESVPSNKKGSSQDVGTPTLQQEALPGKENDDVTNVREKTPASAIGQATAVSVGSPANSGGKSTYSLELMTRYCIVRKYLSLHMECSRFVCV